MLSHNLKIALRNLAKYKLQTLISVLSIAIGIVVLAAAHSVISQHLRPQQITQTPHYDRACRLFLDSLEERKVVSAADPQPVMVDFAVLRAIRSGELYSVELGPTYPNGLLSQTDFRFSVGDTLERKYRNAIAMIDSIYPYYAGYVSAITGKPIAPLRAGEAIVSELTAQTVLGDINPIGVRLQGYYYMAALDLTVVDVYKELGSFDTPVPKTAVLFYTGTGTFTPDDYRYENYYVARWVGAVLKPGCTPEQLAEELNPRLEPMGLKVNVRRVKDVLAEEMGFILTARMVIYFLGSLILLAAMVGYLRMQMQLFWMRKRELSLRIVNGAKRLQLFALLMTEVALVVLLAIGLALLFGTWLEEYVNTFWDSFDWTDKSQALSHLTTYCVAVGSGLFLLCGLMVWLTLGRICKSAQGLAANMRASRSHGFRNAMLWLQITVSMLFVSAALLLSAFCKVIANEQVLPEDMGPYRKCLAVEGYKATHNHERLFDELSKLPEVKQVVPYSNAYALFEELELRDSLSKAMWGSCHIRCLEMQDTTSFDFLNVQPRWLRPELKGERFLLLREDVYNLLEREGLLANGILTLSTMHGGVPYPVAGTFKNHVFNDKAERSSTKAFFIDPFSKTTSTYALLPKAGNYEALKSAAEATVARIEPTLVNPIIFNYLEIVAPQVLLADNMRKAGWILGAVALVICVMGIYSTIALDTRARRKEVVIRKINGAKPKDIALLFARLYVALIGFAILLLLPIASVLQYFLHAVEGSDGDILRLIPFLLLALAGCLIVILAIALIVGWQVHGIMRVNPVEMVAKE